MPETEYLSITEFAAKHGKDKAWIRRLVTAGRLPGMKVGSQWIIEADAELPPDGRVKSGKYRNWRKPKESTEE